MKPPPRSINATLPQLRIKPHQAAINAHSLDDLALGRDALPSLGDRSPHWHRAARSVGLLALMPRQHEETEYTRVQDNPDDETKATVNPRGVGIGVVHPCLDRTLVAQP
jgi:hypothetical protein